MIIIQPGGGLANRLRVIDSAISLTNEPLNILWIKNRDLNCSFNDLFIQNDKLKIIEFDFLKIYAYPDYLTRKLPGLEQIRNIHRKIKFNKTISNSVMVDAIIKQKDIKSLINGNKVYIETCERFGYSQLMHQYFQPTMEIKKSVNKILKNNNNFIGLHIRRSDNSEAILNSPIYLFEKEVEKEIKNNNNIKFFLATDDMDVKSKLKHDFPNHIISNDHKINRNSSDGIKNALIDFLCLSKSNKIIGSSDSSFTFEAANYGRTNLIILKK
jgi:hypothetical protein